MLCKMLTMTIYQACVILGAVTIFGILSWYFIPEDKWLRRETVLQSLHATEGPISAEASGSSGLRRREAGNH